MFTYWQSESLTKTDFSILGNIQQDYSISSFIMSDQLNEGRLSRLRALSTYELSCRVQLLTYQII